MRYRIYNTQTDSYKCKGGHPEGRTNWNSSGVVFNNPASVKNHTSYYADWYWEHRDQLEIQVVKVICSQVLKVTDVMEAPE